MSESEAESPDDAEKIRRWEIPAIDGNADNGFITAGRMQELQKQAWEEAYEAGRQEGLQAGSDESKSRVERLDHLLTALARPFDELDETVEKQLVELAMTVVKQLFRRELRAEPSHVIGVVRDAIKLLPVASRDVQVLLHPDDAALVRESLSPAEGERAWTIVEDPLISRGGCKITTENSQVDAQAEARLQAIIDAITGDERQR